MQSTQMIIVAYLHYCLVFVVSYAHPNLLIVELTPPRPQSPVVESGMQNTLSTLLGLGHQESPAGKQLDHSSLIDEPLRPGNLGPLSPVSYRLPPIHRQASPIWTHDELEQITSQGSFKLVERSKIIIDDSRLADEFSEFTNMIERQLSQTRQKRSTDEKQEAGWFSKANEQRIQCPRIQSFFKNIKSSIGNLIGDRQPPAANEPKVALVTGSSSGIGEATVKLLARKGYQVAIVGTQRDRVERVAKECTDLSPKKLQPLELVLDFKNPDNGEVAVRETIERFGRLDVLINNAGTFSFSSGADPSSYDAYRNMMTINTDATVRATLAAAETLKKAHGHLLFVSSVASVKPSAGSYAYSMSKAAMSMFAKCLAVDLAPEVRVNVISPGPILTPMFGRAGISPETAAESMKGRTLQGKIGRPDQVASAIVFLISDKSSFVHGHELFIDGGHLAKP